ncbi:hypothetical protein PDIG_37060 [Penicillium digitatum PHI26]|uniref:Uncharacterized protein n=2 Tax=Penicillium digitatum TaxID=36651 RepID=K9FY98_PEND2|nr:hypothetical protein PDIP_83650 [Penicillium digitatum Pd1]EKV05316.1 hypothetical protein PDIP_83650 [Penicillium digitatum Pd1]EKV13517.1 hypothetical protein PDIG_37060 [Penicillium digitatum PHI26]
MRLAPNRTPFFPVSSILSFVPDFASDLSSRVPVRLCGLCWRGLPFTDHESRKPMRGEDCTD